MDDEQPRAENEFGETPEEYVERLAQEQAAAEEKRQDALRRATERLMRQEFPEDEARAMTGYTGELTTPENAEPSTSE